MSDLEFIVNTMKQERDAVGFIRNTTLQTQYIDNQRYIIQRNTHGIPVGYLLHGSLRPASLLSITQALIDVDRRNIGFGEQSVISVIERAKQAQCRAIKVRCAEDLQSNGFWQALGFQRTAIEYPPNTRHRAIYVYTYDLWPLLFSHES